MKARTSISLRDRKLLKLDDFRGADFTTAPQKIKTSQAQYSENFVVDGGLLKKRNGWREVLNLDGRINGIFEYGGYMLIHAGEKLYKYSEGECHSVEADVLLPDEKSQAFDNDGRLFIICKGMYIYNGEKLLVATGEDVHVPTIVLLGESHEPMNALTPIVKEARQHYLKSSSWDEANDCWEYSYSVQNVKDIKLSVPADMEELVGVEYLREVYRSGEGFIDDGSWARVPASDCLIEEELDYRDRPTGKFYIRMNGYGEPIENATGEESYRIVYVGHENEMENIRIVYKRKDFTPISFEHGAVFGAGERSDRLFLAAGNKEYYSASGTFSNSEGSSESWDFLELGNFSYIPSKNVAAFGDDTPITGFGSLNDGTLCVYKKDKIYYQTKTVSSATDENGKLTYYKESFPILEGKEGRGCANPFVARLFFNDTLIADDEGVCGVVIDESSLRTRRNTAERSYPISKKLKEYSMKDAYAFVHDDKYYLSFEGDCFVADARKRYRPDESLGSSYNYDWYYLTGIPARIFGSFDKKLYFGTSYDKGDGTHGGKLCVFDEEYSDREYYLSDAGEVGVEFDPEGALIFEKDLEENAKCASAVETRAPLYWAIGDACADGSRCRFVESGRLLLLNEDDEVFVDAGDEGGELPTGLETGVPYVISDIDWGDASFTLIRDGEVISFEGEIRITGKTGEWYRLSPTDKGWVREQAGFNLNVARYGGEDVSVDPIIVRLTTERDIEATWISPCLALDSDIHLKSLISLSISAAASSGESVVLGYETRRGGSSVEDRGAATFDFNDFSFENLSFESDFTKTYTKKVYERGFNYITFKISTRGKKACAVSNVTAKYKITKYAKGVK